MRSGILAVLVLTLLFGCGESEESKARKAGFDDVATYQEALKVRAKTAEEYQEYLDTQAATEAAIEKMRGYAENTLPEHLTSFGPVQFSVEEAKKTSLRMRIVAASDLTEPQATKLGYTAVKAVIDWMLAEGRNPKAEWFSITCWVYSPAGESPTGAAQLRRYGRSSYDFNTDRIIWDMNQ